MMLRILLKGSESWWSSIMADDTIWNYINDFLAGIISRQAFWELAKFKHPTHQISFHTLRAIDCLGYIKGDVV